MSGRGKNKSGREGHRISLHGMEFEEAVDALLEAKPDRGSSSEADPESDAEDSQTAPRQSQSYDWTCTRIRSSTSGAGDG